MSDLKSEPAGLKPDTKECVKCRYVGTVAWVNGQEVPPACCHRCGGELREMSQVITPVFSELLKNGTQSSETKKEIVSESKPVHPPADHDNIKLWLRSRSFGTEPLIEEMHSALTAMNIKTMCSLRALVALFRPPHREKMTEIKGYPGLSVECMTAFMKAIETPFYVGERFMYSGRMMEVTRIGSWGHPHPVADYVPSSWCDASVLIDHNYWESLSPISEAPKPIIPSSDICVSDTKSTVSQTQGNGAEIAFIFSLLVIVAILLCVVVVGGSYGAGHVQRLVLAHNTQINSLNSQIAMLQTQIPVMTGNYLREASRYFESNPSTV